MFISTLPFRINVDENISFINFCHKISKDSLALLRHQKYPYEFLLEHVRNSNSNIPNLYDIVLSYQNARTNRVNFDIPYEVEWIPNYKTSASLSIHLHDLNDNGLINIAYDYQLTKYTQNDIYNIHKRLLNIFDQIFANENIFVKDISIVTKEEEHEIIHKFNNTSSVYPSDSNINKLFEKQVLLNPNKIAVNFYGKNLTYEELNNYSNSLAFELINLGVKPGDYVGIFLDKSLEMIVAMLAILKTGAAFLPIDIDYPEDRINYMLEDSMASIVLTSKNIKNKFEFKNKLYIDLDNELYSHISANPNLPILSTDIAYAMYTSGSTGKPKGVMVTHKNIMRLVLNTNYIHFLEDEHILQTGSPVFDACTFEIWGALLNGFTLYIIKKEDLLSPSTLQDYLLANNITTLWITAPLFSQLSDSNPHMFSHVHNLLTGGDVLSPKHINMVRSANPNLNIINGYGPTENTTFSCCFNIDKYYDDDIPIRIPCC